MWSILSHVSFATRAELPKKIVQTIVCRYTHHSSSLCVTKNSFNCCLLKSCLYSLYLVMASESDMESSCEAKNCFSVSIGGCVCMSELLAASKLDPALPPPPLKQMKLETRSVCLIYGFTVDACQPMDVHHRNHGALDNDHDHPN